MDKNLWELCDEFLEGRIDAEEYRRKLIEMLPALNEEKLRDVAVGIMTII